MSCFLSLAALWGRLIEPITLLEDTDTRRKSRLLAALMLSVGLGITPIFVSQQLYRVSATTTAGHIVSLVLVFGLYWLSRYGRVQAVALSGNVLGTVTIFALALSKPYQEGTSQLYFLIAGFAFALALLSRKTLIVIAVVHIAGMIGYGLLVPPSILFVIKGPFTFYLVLANLLLLASHYNARLQAEQQALLVASEARYRMLVENMLDIVYTLAPTGEIVSVNRAAEKLVGWSRDDLVGKKFIEFIHPDDQAHAVEEFQRNVSSGKQIAFEGRVLTKSGEYKWLESNGAAHIETGQIVEIFGVVRDISTRKQAEEQKMQLALERERLALVENFVQAMSHDFRTSLTTIETSRHLIERKLNDADRRQLQPKLNQIQTAILHLSDQLENLRGLLPLADPMRESCDLNRLLAEVADEFAPLARRRQQTLLFVPNGDLPPVMADARRVRQAVGHLLRNALNYTPERGTISLRSAHRGQSISVEVRDSGIGITPEQLPHIFDLFYRGDAARSIESGGVGVGLNFVRAVAVTHGGNIEVESCPGEGSVFTLVLPSTQPVRSNWL